MHPFSSSFPIINLNQYFSSSFNSLLDHDLFFFPVLVNGKGSKKRPFSGPNKCVILFDCKTEGQHA